MEPVTPPWRVLDAPETPSAREPGSSIRQSRRNAPAVGPAPAQPALLAEGVPQAAWLGVALALAGVLVVAAFLLAGQSAGGSVELSKAAASPGSAVNGSGDAAGPRASGEIVVEVAGAVLHPGIYSLATGARVGEAIAAAGGYGPRIDAARAERELNLAAPLRDGERVRVPSRDEPDGGLSLGPSGSAAAGSPEPRLVDLNHASQAELEALPGIGPATAGKIVAARGSQPFTSIDALVERKLVSSRVLEGLRSLVTVR